MFRRSFLAITLELRSSRTSEYAAETMARLLSTLPTPPHELQFLWKQAESIVFEFCVKDQVIHTFLTFPASLEGYITSQITAAYPDILLRKVKDNEETAVTSTVSIGKLVFTSPSICSK